MTELEQRLAAKKEQERIEKEFRMPTEVKEVDWEPIGNAVLAEVIPPVEKTLNGIIIPEVAQKSTGAKALVVAVGPKQTDVKVGDVVMYDHKAQVYLFDLGIEGKFILLEAHHIKLLFKK